MTIHRSSIQWAIAASHPESDPLVIVIDLSFLVETLPMPKRARARVSETVEVPGMTPVLGFALNLPMTIGLAVERTRIIETYALAMHSMYQGWLWFEAYLMAQALNVAPE